LNQVVVGVQDADADADADAMIAVQAKGGAADSWIAGAHRHLDFVERRLVKGVGGQKSMALEKTAADAPDPMIRSGRG
jgi:hypothetical protein